VLVALVFFFVGTVIVAVAKNFTYLLVGRSIQGVGGGGLIALSEVIVTDLVPLRLRGQYFGILSAMWSVGSVTGPILGGGFSQGVSWVSHFRVHGRDRTSRTYQNPSVGYSTSTSPSSQWELLLSSFSSS
jgi:MFS family permease